MVLRNALGPYIYTFARAFYDTAVAVVHPLYYDYGGDAAVFDPPVLQREYMFGDAVLAAPITAMTGSLNGTIPWPVYLPAGEQSGGGWRRIRCHAEVLCTASLGSLESTPRHVPLTSLCARLLVQLERDADVDWPRANE